MFQLSVALAQVTVTALAARALGSWCVGSRWNFKHGALRAAASTALGLILLSYTIFVLSLLRVVTETTFAILFLILSLIAAPAALRAARRVATIYRDRSSSVWLILLGGFIYSGWMILCALLPARAVDELVYHLAVPQQLLKAGGVTSFPDNIYAYFPQLAEMLFLFGFAIAGEVGAKLFHILFGFLLALALYGFSRKYVSGNRALLVLAIFFSIPSVMVILPRAYVELTFALYALIAIAALLEFFETQDQKWTVAAGIMVGGALATKYTGLQFLLLLILLILLEHLWARRKTLPMATLILLIASTPFLIPYLWRNWHWTGWPLFPFDLGILGLDPGINWDPERARLYLKWLALYGTTLGQESLWDSILAPLFVFVKARFDSATHYDGVIGPVFLLTPFLLARAQKPRAVRLLIIFCVIFFFYWALTTKQIRFLIPLLPVLSFLLVFGLTGLRSQMTTILVVGLVTVSLGVGVKRVWEGNPLPFWLGKESRQEYLSRVLIGYPIYRETNQRLGPDDRLYLLNMRNFGYYLECRWRADFVFEFYRLQRFLGAAKSSDELVDFFSSHQVTHLLIDESITKSALKPEHLAKLQSYLKRWARLLARDRGQALYKLLAFPNESVRTSTPGSFLPARNSSAAPPPVEMCVMPS